MTTDYDLTVIGAGCGGYVAALRAAKLGLRVALVEEKNLGGVCLNVGCVPAKTLLRHAEIIRAVRLQGSEFGFSFDDLRVDYGTAFRRSRKVAARLVKGIELLMKKNGVEVIRGRAAILSPHQAEVVLPSGEMNMFSTGKLVIATGARPRSLPGLDFTEERVISYREAILQDTPPARALIVGGGAIGMEFAYLWRSYGSEVTVIEKLDRLLPTQEEEVSRELERSYRRSGIEFYTSADLKAVNSSSAGVEIIIEQGGKEVTASGDEVLVAVGFTPRTENIGLERLGVKLTERGGFIAVDEKMRTSVEDIYAVGDVTGKLMLAHAAFAMGEVAAEDAAGLSPAPLEYEMIPRCVYCRPQAASFGWSEEEAKERGYSLKVGRFPFLANSKALALNEREGFVKIIADEKTEKLLGASLVGADVTELLPELTLARSAGLPADQVARSIHAHPTLSEAIQEAALDLSGRALHI